MASCQKFSQCKFAMNIRSFVNNILMYKEWHFHFKNEILKQADFASEWQKLCFRELEIFKIFRGMMLLDPPFIEAPLLKT